MKIVDEDGNEIEDDDDFEDEFFNCRDCKKRTEMGDGDDVLLLCDKCLKKYDEEKIWEDFEADIIEEEELSTVDLKKYLIKKK